MNLSFLFLYDLFGLKIAFLATFFWLTTAGTILLYPAGFYS